MGANHLKLRGMNGTAIVADRESSWDSFQILIDGKLSFTRFVESLSALNNGLDDDFNE